MSIGQVDTQLNDGLKGVEGALGWRMLCSITALKVRKGVLGGRTSNSRSVGLEDTLFKDDFESTERSIERRTPSSRMGLTLCG